jgi:3-deoxy-D-manno-octulosonic-acid transferase
MPIWFLTLYTLLWCLALPLAFLRLWWRGLGNVAYRAHWLERLGFCSGFGKVDVWLHAVSVGEARAALPLVRALLASKQSVLVTCTTPTGRDTCRELFGEQVAIAYLPFDAPFLIARFLKATRPKLGILMETELWPGVCAMAKRSDVALWLVNARMSNRSARGYAKGGSLTKSMLACLSGIAAQTKAHAAHFVALGAPNVHVVGNLKFDLTVPAHLNQRADRLVEHLTGGAAAMPYWIAGSTREGEEAMLLEALSKHPLRARAMALIVPRHPERWAETAALAAQLGFRVAKRTDAKIASGSEVIIGDSMGELLTYYANAKVAVMGGTLGNTGGQNLIEPCAVGVPVVLGPSVFNFEQAAEEAVDAGAAFRVEDAKAALDQVLQLFDDELHRKAASQRGREFVAKHRGATERTFALLEFHL